MSLFHQLFVLGEEPISFAFGMHKIYRSLDEEHSISVQEYLGLCFGKTSSLEGNSCATIYGRGMEPGSCFYVFPFWKLVSFESPFDCDGFIFWCRFISKTLSNLFFFFFFQDSWKQKFMVLVKNGI